MHSNQRERSDGVSPILPAFPVCQRSSWNKQGEIEKKLSATAGDSSKVAFPSPCSSEQCVRSPSRWPCLYSPAAQHPEVLVPRCLDPGPIVTRVCPPEWDLLPEGRGYTFMPCPQDVTSVPALPGGQQYGDTASRDPAVTPWQAIPTQPFFLLMLRVPV